MRRTVLVLVAMLGLTVTGCADEEERLTQEEFVEQGNAICQKASDDIEKEAEEAFADNTDEDPPSDEEFNSFARDTAVPAFERQLEELEGLNPPEDTEKKLDAALDEARKAITEVEDDPSVLLDEDDDTFDKANELIGEAGLDTCAEE